MARAARPGDAPGARRGREDACTQLALAGGAYLARPFEHKDSPDAAFERRERRFSAACDGFDVHCAVRIAADDDQRRERLVRYCSRPAFALDRIELLPHGRIAYLLRTPRRLSGGAPHPRLSELALAAPNGSTRARSNVGTDGVRVRRGVGGHPARARHGERTSRSSSQSCTQCTARGPCDGASGCLIRDRRLARRRSRGA
ncbi:transposase [Sorangium sp. So ce693]|uniref:transposase n=1 Tax=Sorangium sp. So ce693 TaxID=3133318 RepID=UPI003F5FA390